MPSVTPITFSPHSLLTLLTLVLIPPDTCPPGGGEAGGAVQEADDEVDPYDLVEAVDILKTLQVLSYQ